MPLEYFGVEIVKNDKENKVYVPKNVKQNLEFFKGFGVKELIITGIVVIISALPVFFIYKTGFIYTS